MANPADEERVTVAATASPAPSSPTPAASTDPRPLIARERFWNLPNTITVFRTAAIPVILMLPIVKDDEWSCTLIAWCFIVAAVTDIVDGWLARRGAQVTSIGKLLDPLADKLLVSTALIVLLAVGRIEVWATWMVVVIVGRELAVTGLRGIASAGGQVVGANALGKLKAVSQNIAIGALLFHYETLGLDANAVGMIALGVATALTIASGYLYFRDYFTGRTSEGEA